MTGILKTLEPISSAQLGRAYEQNTELSAVSELQGAARDQARVSAGVASQASDMGLNLNQKSPRSSEAQGALEKVQSLQEQLAVRAKLEEPKRNELTTPLELLSVEVLAELRNNMGAIKPHEPREQLVSISLRAMSLQSLKPQVVRVSTSGVATDIDLIGEGSERDTFEINSVQVPNSSASDDPLSFEANAQSAIAKAAAINSVALQTNVRAVALPTRTDRQQSLNEELGASVYGNTGAVQATSLNEDAKMIINGAEVSEGNPLSVQERDQGGALREAINALSDETGVTASLNEAGELVLEAADGRNISLAYEGAQGSALERAVGLKGSGEHPYGGRIGLVSYHEVTLNLGKDVNYALGDIAGDFSVMDEAYYSA